jgi:hypothetical protein
MSLSGRGVAVYIIGIALKNQLSGNIKVEYCFDGLSQDLVPCERQYLASSHL